MSVRQGFTIILKIHFKAGSILYKARVLYWLLRYREELGEPECYGWALELNSMILRWEACLSLMQAAIVAVSSF